MRSHRATIRALIAAMALLCLVSIRAAGRATSPAPEGDDAARRLASRAIGATPLMDDLRELCDEIGGRPTGSPACGRAVTWAAAKFRAAGVESVTLEPYTVPVLWLPDPVTPSEAACVAPEPFPLRIAAAPLSRPTPPGHPIEARLVSAGTGKPEDFSRLGQGALGAVALVMGPEMKSLEDLFAEYMKDDAMIEAAGEAQVAGILLASSRPRGLLYRHPLVSAVTIAPIPVAVVSREHASRLARLLERGEVRVKLGVAALTGGPFEAHNVVAEIPGRELPGEVVILGAHLDSWDLGTGAEDNGVNAALVIDVARGIREMKLSPRRTIRFVLFTGEELGLWGSLGYVRAHAAEMDRHVAAVIFDIGSGHTTGFYLNGREELRRPVEQALVGVAALGPFTHPLEALDGTDNFDFLLSGVPNLVAAQETAAYLPDYHAESDVYERVNAREARANAAIASALVWSLADSPSRPAPRQTRAEVGALIQRTGLEPQMKAFGQWEGWVAGTRGATGAKADGATP
jgi:hypothetical protein